VKHALNVRAKTWLGAGLVCCMYAVGPAWAQGQPAQQNAAATNQQPPALVLAPVVVTAELIAQDVEKVPAAITAITGSQIMALGITNAEDLSNIAPNLMAAPNSDGSTVAIRGIVDINQTLQGNSEVSYSEDDVPLIQKIDAFQGMYDVQRVEVLEGPQGTLYGANANAGAINVITNKPNLNEFSGYGTMGLGNYDAVLAQGALNIPLSNTLAVRFAVDHDYHSGYVHLINNTTNVDDEDFDGGRIEMLWRPSGNFSGLLTYEEDHDGGAGDGGAGSGAPLGLYATEQHTTPYGYYAYPPSPTSPQQDLSIRSATLHLDWSLPSFNIAYIGNVRWMYWNQDQPETLYGPDATYCQNVTDPTSCHLTDEILYDRQTSDELRFSNSAGPVQWVAGLYHMRDDDKEMHEYKTGELPDWEDELTEGYYFESDAAYGQATWNITQKFGLVGGLRYQRDAKGEPYAAVLKSPVGDMINSLCIDCTVASTAYGHGSWGKVQWHVGVNYNLSGNSLLFASVATGYEAGGFAAHTTGAIYTAPAYQPENLVNYEIGWKYENRRVEFNVDGFFMHYTGYQVTTSIIEPDGTYLPSTLNSGVAEIKGIELDSKFLLTPRDEVDFDATGLRSVFTQFYLPLGDGYCADGASHCPTNYTGNVLPNSPAATVRLAYQHTFNLRDNMSLTPRVDSFYSTQYWLDYHDYAAVSQRAYTRSDASLTFDDHLEDDKTFSTQIYIRNIENTPVLAGGQADANAPDHDFNEYGKNGYYLAPRTYGIQFTVSF
jgi:iron complex outermembrane recepter protein